ncbi:MAG TPA: hypothetical protein VGS41_17480, partial [Chthonomonadales bacterium]|nr:hypothetical protein [Chthonomonadales bacterium]
MTTKPLQIHRHPAGETQAANPAESPDSSGGYYVITWGCQMNDEDSEQIGIFLRQMGYRPVDGPERADVVILNTCSVRAKPEEKVWSELGRLKGIKQLKPAMIIGVCGC